MAGKLIKIPKVDESLSLKGESADAYVVGQKFNGVYCAEDKASGTYVGNGSSDLRNVTTGGKGTTIFVLCEDYVAQVTPLGAIAFKKDGTETRWIADASFLNDLSINTTDSALNESGVTYTYYVL